MSAHATLAPSGAYRWAAPDGCRGAASMQARYPERGDSPAAIEGTAAHLYVTETLLGRDVPAGTTEEMIDCGTGFIEYVWEIGKNHPTVTLRVEERVYMTSIHDAECWGTPDVYLLDRDKRVLHVWDYKYGHRYVDAYRNWQLILYAIGVLDSEGVDTGDWKHWSINLHIGQPRNYHPDGPMRTWSFGGPMLLSFLAPLRHAAIEALMPGALLRTGDHCRDCTARHSCNALQAAAALSVDIADQQTPMDLSPHALGLELHYLRAAEKRISARADALEAEILAAVTAGRNVPLWKGDYSSGRERWTKPAAEVAALGDMFGVDLRKPLECITPPQARKAGVAETVVAGYSERPRGSLKLVPVTDNTISKAFGA